MRLQSWGVFLLWVLFVFFSGNSRQSSASDLNLRSATPSKTIAVAAVEDGADAEISKVAARASYFLIFDENGVFLKAMINPGKSRERRASSAVVDLLLKESCTVVIAGNFGEKLQRRLKESGIAFVERGGIAGEAVRDLVK